MFLPCFHVFSECFWNVFGLAAACSPQACDGLFSLVFWCFRHVFFMFSSLFSSCFWHVFQVFFICFLTVFNMFSCVFWVFFGLYSAWQLRAARKRAKGCFYVFSGVFDMFSSCFHLCFHNVFDTFSKCFLYVFLLFLPCFQVFSECFLKRIL